MDVLTFDRATLSVAAISSAGTARGDRYSSAWICATVRLIPHRVPISPQCRMYCFCNPVSSAMTFLSVRTEYTEKSAPLSSVRERRHDNKDYALICLCPLSAALPAESSPPAAPASLPLESFQHAAAYRPRSQRTSPGSDCSFHTACP